MKYKIAIIFIGIIFFWGFITLNSLIDKEESAKGQWANVENQYQRRADLIPNLVNVVKAYASHENSTFVEVTNLRSRATNSTVSFDNFDSGSLDSYKNTQNEIGEAINKLLVIAESYPELRANQNFLELQAQLEGAENRISTERMRYNKAVNKYNSSIRKFPSNIISRLLSFKPLPYFQAQDGTDHTPNVSF